MSQCGYVLVGPTASGKSSVAEFIAKREGWHVLSADSMQVYEGLDISTAKTPESEGEGISYSGLDLVPITTRFTAWQYRQYAISVLRDYAAKHISTIVVGGSGLYVRALTEGLREVPDSDPEFHKRWMSVMEECGIDGLQKKLEDVFPGLLEQVQDPQNPRRLIRAAERYEASGEVGEENWRPVAEQPVITGLRWESGPLRARIFQRVDQMYNCGLLDEAERLIDRGLSDSPTARQALGYQEAMLCLDGVMTESEARERTVTRTWQLAKRQMTWFRHQANVDWIDVDDAMSTDGIAEKVMHSWRKYGAAEIPD